MRLCQPLSLTKLRVCAVLSACVGSPFMAYFLSRTMNIIKVKYIAFNLFFRFGSFLFALACMLLQGSGAVLAGNF